jgi:hypothetical protein
VRFGTAYKKGGEKMKIAHKIHLVFGPQTRIVPITAPGGRVSAKMVDLHKLAGEQFLGMIGHVPTELTSQAAREILAMRGAGERSLSGEFRITAPEMIGIPGSPSKRIMKDEISVELFRAIMPGYKVTGDSATELRAILADPRQTNKPLTPASLFDARVFATEYGRFVGGQFRVPTDEEVLAAIDMLRGPNRCWTEVRKHDGTYLLRELAGTSMALSYAHPEERPFRSAFRLIEDIA